MSYSFKNFEKEIDPTIVKRGKEYFTKGHVTELEEEEKGQWVAAVEGSEDADYEVEVDIARNRIRYYDCSCPYDHGPVCKHVAAVLFAIQAKLKPEKKTGGKDTAASNKQASKKKMIQEILDNVNYQDLRKFLVEFAMKKNEFGSQLLTRFAEHTGVEGKEKYDLIVKNSLAAASARDGLIEPGKVRLVAKPVTELLAQAEHFISKKFYAEALYVCQAVIENLVARWHDIYDQGGKIQDAINQAFILLNKISNEPIPKPLHDTFINYVLEALKNTKYLETGLDILWLGILNSLARDGSEDNRIISFIQTRMDEYLQTNKEPPSVSPLRHIFFYTNQDPQIDFRKYALFLVKFYNDRKKTGKVQKVFEKYSQLDDFREILIKQALEAENNKQARQLVQEALDKAKQRNNIHQVNKWEEWQLTIAKAENNLPEIRQLLKQFFLRSLDIDVYREYKATFTTTDWPEVFRNLMAEFFEKQKNAWFNYAAVFKIYAEEKEWDNLLALLRKSPTLQLLQVAGNYLPAFYHPGLLELFEDQVQKYARYYTTKKSYSEVADILRFMLTLEGGKPVVQKLIARFKTEYHLRRTMIDILNKIKVD